MQVSNSGTKESGYRKMGQPTQGYCRSTVIVIPSTWTSIPADIDMNIAGGGSEKGWMVEDVSLDLE